MTELNGVIELTGEVAGLFKIEAFRADVEGNEIPGSRRVAADWFPNLITDNGLNLIGSSSTWLTWCQVGSGSTPPVALDTALVSRIAGTSTRDITAFGAQSAAPYFAWRRNTYRFAEGVAAGNIAEVGVGAATTGNLLSRALILDGSGNPTTIQVLADETLDVTYEFRYYPPTVDWIGSVTLAGIDHAVLGRAANVTSGSDSAGWVVNPQGSTSTFPGAAAWMLAFNGGLGLITSSPSGAQSGASATSDASYSAGSHQRSGTVTWGLSSGNLSGGVGSVLIKHGVGAYQFGFTPPIPKDATKILTLTFRHSWARRP